MHRMTSSCVASDAVVPRRTRPSSALRQMVRGSGRLKMFQIEIRGPFTVFWWEGCIHFPMYHFFNHLTDTYRILTKKMSRNIQTFLLLHLTSTPGVFRGRSKVCLMTKRFVPCYGLFYKGLVQRTRISMGFWGTSKKPRRGRGKKRCECEKQSISFLEWSLFEVPCRF